MSKILLLYDMQEKDLARDVHAFLETINVPTVLIPLQPNSHATLSDKEAQHFDNKDGAIFLLTAGCERLGTSYPSPSVSHEMGQAKQKFNPANVIYLVEKGCSVPAIDQKPYISFERTNMRSVIEAITTLVNDLKAIGCIEKNNGVAFVFRNDCYWEEGNRHPICSHCWDAEKKKIQLHSTGSQGYSSCPACKKMVCPEGRPAPLRRGTHEWNPLE